MNAEEWRSLRSILERAMELDPEDRSGWLDSVCAGDDRKRGEVDSLLRAGEEFGRALEQPAFSLCDPAGDDCSEERLPERVGPFKVLHRLGVGGMGSVYLAERDDQEFQQRVAVKILARELADREGLQHFRRERQILARLGHPYIAHCFDGGATEDGRPYLVMEYVAGDPIDVYCDAQRLTITQRVRLFEKVCAASHYAHQNLVVHRDIKPSNILVTADGVPKLLDFGIANLIEAASAENRSESLVSTARMLTPDYASPEQIRGEPASTRCDVYALGVLLYKLLTGAVPFRFETSLPEEIDRMLRGPGAPPPSQRFSRADGSDAELAATYRARSGGPDQLRRILRGDLDSIVLKALHPFADQRYASVESLVEDLKRWREGKPVTARPNTLTYRSAKLLRRHRLAVVTAAVLFLSAVGFVSMQAVNSARVSRERSQTAYVAEFLVDLFDTSAIASAGSREITAEELLVQGSIRARNAPAGTAAQATVLEAIGRAFYNLGFYDRAVSEFRSSLAVRRSLLGDEHPQVAGGLHNLARALHTAGDFAESEQLFSEALRIRLQQGAGSLQVAETLVGLGDLRRAQGRYRDGVAVFRDALAIRESRLPRGSREIVESQYRLGGTLYELGEYGEAQIFLTMAVAGLQVEGDSDDLARSLSNLGSLYLSQGDVSRAEPLLLESAAMRHRLYDDEHPQFATGLTILAQLRYVQRDYDASITLLRQALGIFERRLGTESIDTIRTQFNLAEALFGAGEYAEAERFYRASLAVARRLVGENHPRVANLLGSLGKALFAQHRTGEAEVALRQSVELLEATVGQTHPDLALVRLHLGRVLLSRRQLAEAETLLRQAATRLSPEQGASDADVLDARVELSACLLELGRTAEGRALLDQAEQLIVSASLQDHPAAKRTRDLHARAHSHRGS